MKKTYISLITKSLIIIFAVLGLIVNLVNAEVDGYSSAASRLLYFTNLSNIFVLVVAMTFLFLEIKRLKGGADLRGARMYLTKLVSVVSITLTGVIFCAVLAPGASNADYNAWTFGNIIVHTVVPFLAILDFFIDSGNIKLNKKHNLFSLAPPLIYFLLCIALYLLNVDFGRGDNFPYFFLNFGSPAGIFGFSEEFPYRIGTFYWVAFISAFVYSISLLYSFLHNLKIKKK
jgi:hypothetical protein